MMLQNIDRQSPLVMQPIWKTEGKKLRLHQNAFDILVWSNFAFTRLFFQAASDTVQQIGRPVRSIIWIMKMLADFVEDGQINHSSVLRTLAFGPRNDKAFSMPGRATYPFLRCDELAQPRMERSVVKDIILGGGQNLLSPEQRLDAVIQSSLELFL
jgi:hypothetical protein